MFVCVFVPSLVRVWLCACLSVFPVGCVIACLLVGVIVCVFCACGCLAGWLFVSFVGWLSA